MKIIAMLALAATLAFASVGLTGYDPFVTTGNVPSGKGFRSVTVVDGLEHPWSMAWLPGGDILVTERPGRVRVVRGGKLLPQPVEGVPEVFARGQGGLLDMAVHPDFAANRLVYFTYAHGTSEANRTRLARAAFDGRALTGWTVLFEVSTPKPGSQHFGSRMLWLPDRTLLVSIGDGGNPPVRLDGELIRENAQRLDRHLGKVLRLNDDGSIPSDNPFVGREGADPAVWSYGHRNIQGLAYDPVHGQVWATEHGALGGDELNALDAGLNFGWPRVSYSREYFSGARISEETSMAGMVDPVVVWLTAIAPSGLAVYTGDRYEGWQGDLFAGGLVGQDVRRLDVDGDGRVVGQQALRMGERVRDVRQGPDGLLYVLTDADDGRLIRLDPAPGEEGEGAP